jgi:hypothetical protein
MWLSKVIGFFLLLLGSLSMISQEKKSGDYLFSKDKQICYQNFLDSLDQTLENLEMKRDILKPLFTEGFHTDYIYKIDSLIGLQIENLKLFKFREKRVLRRTKLAIKTAGLWSERLNVRYDRLFSGHYFFELERREGLVKLQSLFFLNFSMVEGVSPISELHINQKTKWVKIDEIVNLSNKHDGYGLHIFNREISIASIFFHNYKSEYCFKLFRFPEKQSWEFIQGLYEVENNPFYLNHSKGRKFTYHF